MTGYSQLKQAMREQLVVNAGVMIREHFRKRLRAKKLVGQIMYACYNVEETDMLEALQMRDVLTPDGEEWSEKWIPWPDNIKKNGMEFYIRLIGSSRASWRIEWRLFQTRRGPFKVMRWTVMRRAFAIDRYETRKEECPLSKTEFLQLPVEEKYEHASHLFANEIKSDGYSASVLYYRPKHEELGGEDDSLVPEGAREYLRLQAPRRRSRRKWIRRAKRARHRNNRDIVSVTTREYRHLAGFNRFRAWNESQKRKFPDYKSVIEGMPCSRPRVTRNSKTDRTDCKQAHVRSLRGLEPTRWHKGSRSKSGQGVEGGAAEARDGGFHGRVQDEQALLAVHQSLSSVQYPTPVFPKGVQKPKRRKMKGKVLPRDWSRAEIKSKHCHVVLRCENEDCEARYWDRDVNAAFNMLELLKSEVQGRGRMEPFRRA
ncbi:hypothetical protein GQ600_962 [Phytophthora cactorum]|nr:hypothetical protein GQ600_962 [Phytophthora cactorum]